MTPLEKARLKYQPTLPKILEELADVTFQGQGKTAALGDEKEIEAQFPQTFGRPLLHAEKGAPPLPKALKVGVVFSGGQAPGGHNVIMGLFDALKKCHYECQLIGFLDGPSGIVEGKTLALSEDLLAKYRNLGGFDLIGSGRTKIETEEQLEKSVAVFEKLGLDGVVIIGGDDSNTNAAILAEYCLAKGCSTKIIGVPKTIDGDLKNPYVDISFGFHTATATYAEMIGNIARDACSARKYTHFIKLMGRAASHIALECALKTQPNLTLIGEEVAAKKMTLKQVTSQIADLVEKRARQGKNYGVVLLPEGIVEFIPEMKTLIGELNALLAEGKDENALSAEAQETFTFLPKEIQQQLLLDRDPHGNVQVAHIQTDLLFSTTVKEEMKNRASFKGKFSPLHHFFGYEGRAALPTNFDATYCYGLGHVAALLIRDGETGYMCALRHLTKPAAEWAPCAIPITSLMNLEVRKGKEKAVIQKALVDLDGAAFKAFDRARAKWMEEDHYLYPGPIQFAGDLALTDQVPLSI
ncbi:diphosphate--fructose-6-phosphate 1-phosphotransferase [Candidatus Neptunochlamydia vexilliferae]|uniref:Pyrophosphate--fructose 6-phosphate 1-phosphotransferase n=1 Tax=Candidatus Neptunichlamydia vexilliferae TaxID=1651774 RepID=A0ABS0B1A7_9BACT|nr:diphosphate--fructose-6-phosphate 1-phosphotransferase [Candidatus Neptunochlamydia vexilliferae]MBF5060191.1 Pyrophosphate--fructose 6-phosphate 1-phosphotransferase [Candidatus Neptunochlamydia vexilliferae]